MHVCTHVSVCVRIHISHICICVRLHVHVYAGVHVCVYMCVCACTCMHVCSMSFLCLLVLFYATYYPILNVRDCR